MAAIPAVYIEAEYADGYVLTEGENDVSPFDPGRNIFHAIVNRTAEPEHGKTVRFTLFVADHRVDIDCTKLPDDTTFIREKHMERDADINTGQWLEDPRIVGIDFGYSFINDEGIETKELVEVR